MIDTKAVKKLGELKQSLKPEMKFIFPLGNDPQWFNWVKLQDVSKKLNVKYKITFSSKQGVYLFSIISNGEIKSYGLIEKHNVCKHKKRLFINRLVIKSFLVEANLVKE